MTLSCTLSSSYWTSYLGSLDAEEEEEEEEEEDFDFDFDLDFNLGRVTFRTKAGKGLPLWTTVTFCPISKRGVTTALGSPLASLSPPPSESESDSDSESESESSSEALLALFNRPLPSGSPNSHFSSLVEYFEPFFEPSSSYAVTWAQRGLLELRPEQEPEPRAVSFQRYLWAAVWL